MKDVPETVAAHPIVFATLTAPSFGPVHTAKKPGRSGSRRCRPRCGDRRQLCLHGRRRFTIALRRQLARHLGLSEAAAQQLVRVQFAKVAEYQRRGVIHFHALIRLDGKPTDLDAYPPPAVQVDSATLAELVRCAAAQVAYTAPAIDGKDQPRRLRLGAQVDARPVTGQADRETHGADLHPETVAAYIAKYATKAAADLPTDQNNGNGHLRQMQVTLRHLSGRALIPL
jgi:hypothetical protein